MRKISIKAAVFACLLTFIGGIFAYGYASEVMIPASAWAEPHAGSDETEDGSMILFERVLEIIDERSVKEVEREQLIRGAIDGMLGELDDPYAGILERDDLDGMMEDYENRQYAGVGIRITPSSEGVRILSIFPDSPAEEAGLEVGDTIIQVDETDISERDLSEIGDLIRGPEGTYVNVTVVRDGQELEPINVERREVVRPTMTYHKTELDGRVFGHIHIERFAQSTPDEFEHVLDEFEDVDGLLLDVRANPGGTLSAAIGVADSLVPEGPILRTEERGGEVGSEYESDTAGIDVPIVVVIDNHTASGAEIVAGAVRDRCDALLVGTDSFGKGTVQSIYDLDKAGLRLTTSEFVLPSGYRIADGGLTPDIYIRRTGRVSLSPRHISTEPIGPGDRGDKVRYLAGALSDLGYLDGRDRDRYDSEMRRAVVQLQIDSDLAPTGLANEETLDLLDEMLDSDMQELLEYLENDVEEKFGDIDWLASDRQLMQSFRALWSWIRIN